MDSRMLDSMKRYIKREFPEPIVEVLVFVSRHARPWKQLWFRRNIRFWRRPTIADLLEWSERELELSFLLTHRCPCRCKHCDLWREKGEDDCLTMSTIQKLLSDARRKGFKTINITGGDPLMHRAFFEVLDLCRAFGFESISVNTSGLLLKGKMLERFMNAPIDRVVLSLDGEATVHDEFRGVKGSHDRVLDVIEALSPKMEIQLSFVISSKNYDQLPYVIEIGKKYGCRVTCQPFDVSLSTSSRDRSLVLEDLHKIEALERDLRTYKSKKGYSRTFSPTTKHIKAIVEYLRDSRSVKTPCLVGYWRAHVDAQGNIFPCYPLGKIGNVCSEDFGETWESDQYNQVRKEMIKRNCPNCLLNCYTVINEGLARYSAELEL